MTILPSASLPTTALMPNENAVNRDKARAAAMKAGAKLMIDADRHAAAHYERAIELSATPEQKFDACLQKHLAHKHRQSNLFGLTINLHENQQSIDSLKEAEKLCPGRSAAADIFNAYLDRYSLQLVGAEFSALCTKSYGINLLGLRIGLRLLPKHDQHALREALLLFPRATQNVPDASTELMETVVEQKISKKNQQLIVQTVIPSLLSIFAMNATPANEQFLANARASSTRCLERLATKAWSNRAASSALQSTAFTGQ